MKKLVMIFIIAQAYGTPLTMKDSMSTDVLPSILIGGFNYVRKFGWTGKPMRDDYRYSPGIGYHKFHTRAKTWNEARKICIDEGGHLAIINSEVEALVLREMLATATDLIGAAHENHAYLGIHNFFNKEDWTTVLGEPLARTGYDHWYTNEPNHAGPRELCGAMGVHGRLLDFNCDLPYAFFCEVPI